MDISRTSLSDFKVNANPKLEISPRNMVPRAIVFLSIFLFVLPSAFASIQCEGSVRHVVVYNNGIVRVKFSWHDPGLIQLCNLEKEWQGVKPSACEGMLAAAQEARSNNLNTKLDYETYTHTCANVPDYSKSLSPSYFGIW